MSGSLRNVLFTNIDQVLAKHLKLKSKSKLKGDQVEILEAFKKNLETYTFDRYQTKQLDLEKAVSNENERQKDLMNFEVKHETFLTENFETARMNRVNYGMENESDPEIKKLYKELDEKREERIRSETLLMQTIADKDD